MSIRTNYEAGLEWRGAAYAVGTVWPPSPGRVCRINAGRYYGVTVCMRDGRAVVADAARASAVRVREWLRPGDVLLDWDPAAYWGCWVEPVGGLPDLPPGREVRHPGYTPGEVSVYREGQGFAALERGWERAWMLSR